MDKCLICGATSFVAKGFIELLYSKGYEVDTFGRKNGSYLEIDKNKDLSTHYDYVVNFAILKDQSLNENIAFIEALFRLCRLKEVKKLIHFSSIMVYNYHLGRVDENSPIETVSETMMDGYGKIKIAVDEYINGVKNTQPFETILVRPGYVLASGRPAPFIKHLVGSISVILGNKKSKQPVVRREDIHSALIKMIETGENLPVYHLFQNNNVTKYEFARKTVGGVILTLPKPIFEGIPHLFMKIGLIRKSLYIRFDGMYNYNVTSSELTEKKLNIKFS